MKPVNDPYKLRRQFTLTALQLRDALEFINPDENDEDQLESEITFKYCEEGKTPKGDDNLHLPEGWYCWITEYPEEGCYGPLGVRLQPLLEKETPWTKAEKLL